MVTPEEVEAALELARSLARLGAPLFLAQPDPAAPTGYALPARWQEARPDPTVPDHWRPGMALCMVTGVLYDLVDDDPRAGGVPPGFPMPQAYLSAWTPSGGSHHFVAPIGVESLDGVAPGADLKSGTPDGRGRGFAYLAPTVRRSKVDGSPRAYRWFKRAGDWPREAQPPPTWDHSGLPLRQLVELRRARAAPEGAPRRLPRSAAMAEWDRARAALAADVARWAATGWGGEAHAGLLRHGTHLARLSPDHARDGYLAAFAAAGVEPDEDDLAKLEGALGKAVPDVVVPDEECAPQDLFWAGVQVTERPKAPAPADPLGRDDRAPFAFLTEEEAEAIPPPDPLVDGLLFLASKARIFGESTRGKTWVALDLAAHVSLGLPWLGRQVKQGPALFVAAEGAPSFAPRMRTWALAHDGRRSGVRFWPEPVPIGGPTWGEFCAAVAREGFALVVGDTQGAMTVGRAENDNDDAAAVQSALSELTAASGCCYLSVHHVGWADQGRPRGASGMFAGMDTELRLTEGPGGAGSLLLVTEKQRYAEKAKAARMRLVAEHGGLVVRPPLGDAERLLVADEQEVRVAALFARWMAAVESGHDPGQAGEDKVRKDLNGVLREQFGARQEAEVTVREARQVARMYKRHVGVVVDG